jgi:branched-chain amino acid transport system ATP-binding protein
VTAPGTAQVHPGVLLRADQVGRTFGGFVAVDDVTMSVGPGEVVGLLGANGAGKTTTLRAISGMIRTQGEIKFAGARIDGLATEAIAGRGIAHVPDGRGTFMELSVEENLRLGAYLRRDKAGVAQDLERVFNLFPKLKQRYMQQAGTLSGGEQQMLAIARALLLHPRLLLLDEPSFGLAPLIVREIFDNLERIVREGGVSVLIVEQNASLALAIADRAYLLETGRIVMSGPAADIRKDEAVRRSYLGY